MEIIGSTCENNMEFCGQIVEHIYNCLDKLWKQMWKIVDIIVELMWQNCQKHYSKTSQN